MSSSDVKMNIKYLQKTVRNVLSMPVYFKSNIDLYDKLS